ncbi:hypothetical protein [Oscillibacter sp.]|uniref:hypothetical protein n=1 Tax=Oscillibacter sp. TaxID=1945593 RepID=UPI0026239F54|nr:hypothetical protein [Oscillibacter sp.]MDD3346866.1 hypothetical protein [Oscillibacter sp.]
MDRKRQARWDAHNLRTVATKLPLWEQLAFRRACSAAGVSPYALLQRLIREWMPQTDTKQDIVALVEKLCAEG